MGKQLVESKVCTYFKDYQKSIQNYESYIYRTLTGSMKLPSRIFEPRSIEMPMKVAPLASECPRWKCGNVAMLSLMAMWQ